MDVALSVKESIKVSLVKEKKNPTYLIFSPTSCSEASCSVKNRVKITQNSKVSATKLGNAL